MNLKMKMSLIYLRDIQAKRMFQMVKFIHHLLYNAIVYTIVTAEA